MTAPNETEKLCEEIRGFLDYKKEHHEQGEDCDLLQRALSCIRETEITNTQFLLSPMDSQALLDDLKKKLTEAERRFEAAAEAISSLKGKCLARRDGPCGECPNCNRTRIALGLEKEIERRLKEQK